MKYLKLISSALKLVSYVITGLMIIPTLAAYRIDYRTRKYCSEHKGKYSSYKEVGDKNYIMYCEVYK